MVCFMKQTHFSISFERQPTDTNTLTHTTFGTKVKPSTIELNIISQHSWGIVNCHDFIRKMSENMRTNFGINEDNDRSGVANTE